jgi:hypothetical protein
VTLDDLNTTEGIVALAAAGLALLAIILVLVVAAKLRRVRAAQAAVLGGHERRDLVSHAERLEDAFVQLRDWVEDSLGRFEDQSAMQDARIDGCVAYRALIRYDAYGEMSGQQSISLALLDAGRSGFVLSSITHRDQARMYIKQIHEGQPELRLSPEEQQAIDQALASPPHPETDALGAPAGDARQSA